MTEHAPAMACAVCGRILEQTIRADGSVEWTHPADEELKADHPVVAVDVAELPGGAEMRCDFCFDSSPVWSVVTPAITWAIIDGVEHRHADDGWAACETCIDLVRRDQWSALARRIITGYEAHHGVTLREQEVGILKATLRQVRKGMTRIESL
jgi:hypothetical protein